MLSDPISDIVLRAWDAAELVRRRHWRGSVTPVDPVLVARRMSIEVVTVALDAGVDSRLSGTAEAAVIEVADGGSPRDVRRIVAHAVGHVRDLTDREMTALQVVDPPRPGVVDAEGELFADAFGIALRLPEQVVNELLRAETSPLHIARRLDVTLGEYWAYGRLRRRATVARLAEQAARRADGTSSFPPADWW